LLIKHLLTLGLELLWTKVYWILCLALIAAQYLPVKMTGSGMFIICYVTLPPRRSSVVVPNKKVLILWMTSFFVHWAFEDPLNQFL
jgi:hypothetical protein